MSFTLGHISGTWFSEIGVGLSGTILPDHFLVRRGYEGPQIYIEWGPIGATGLVDHFVLVKRLYGYPSGPNDPQGTVLYSGPAVANSISDLDVIPGTFYYYKLYAVLMDGTAHSDSAHQGQVLAITTGFYAEKMWEILPEEYKNSDKRPDLAGATKLRLYQGSGSTAEVFNFGEDGSIAKGQYRRFLKVFGPPLDEAKGLIDYLINQLDFDLSSLTNLNFLAQMLGLNLNTELTPEKMRNEARLQVAYLKIKGTKPGIIARLRAVSTANPIITEQFNNVLYSNDPNRTSLQFISAEAIGINSPDDIIFRSVGFPDTAPFWLWWNVFLDAPETIPLSEVTVRKWCVVVSESSPACHNGFIYVRGYTQDEASFSADDGMDNADAEDSSDFASVSSGYGIFDVPTYDPTRTLLFSDSTRVFDAPDFESIFPGVVYTTPPTSG